jgi:hypothetical protein
MDNYHLNNTTKLNKKIFDVNIMITIYNLVIYFI